MSGRHCFFKTQHHRFAQFTKTLLTSVSTALVLFILIAPAQAAEVADPSTPVTQPSLTQPSTEALISLNQATLEQLQQIKGIGPAKAEAIVRYREGQGAFTSLETLQQVPGIGPALLERMRPYITL
ncbi:ComEA family DNA-binding protein [Terasakiispira papahanaumokuakeensis]|uniref:ComEA family DNA-binding protein n=1 Tax=Terasakiispira papahanaumokuakeensis TaxID=197479 RepID=UPI000A0520C5|nr:ComEA family DNA-binding protein [Terasakiispira papahanaumokuakeensis]